MPAFQSVQYIDPFAPLPTGATQAGVQAVLSSTGAPAGSVAYAQLLADQTPIAYGTGATATAIRVLNPAPLAPTIAYLLQVQFAAPGQNPADLDWSDPTKVISAPVVVAQLRITALEVTATGLTFTWDNPSGAAIAGAYLQIFDNTTHALTPYYYLGVGPAGAVTATFTAGHDYRVSISAVQPVSGGTTGAFGAPYTTGPATTAQPIPTGAPQLTRASCDEGEIAVQWTTSAPPVGAAPATYDLLLLDGANLVAMAGAGAVGGQLTAGQLSTLTSPKVAGRISYGAFAGPIGTGLSLNALAPQILGVIVTGSAQAAVISAQLAAPGALPTGGALVATLYANGVAGQTQTLNAASGQVAWSALVPAANTAYEIDVALVVTAGGQTSQGPRSPRLAVPLTTPQSLVASYDGQTVTIDLAATAAADSYSAVLTATGASPVTVQVGGQLPISFTTNLDLSKAWSAVVTPTIGRVVALPSASATLALPTVTAPSLTVVDYDGQTLRLQWTAAVLPFLTGYTVTVAGLGAFAVSGGQTAYDLPLTPAQATTATVKVAGVSALRTTADSATVAVIASLATITQVTPGASVTASWTVTNGPAAAVRGELLIGETLAALVVDVSTTGCSFTAPTPANQPFRLRARVTDAAGLAVGPPSPAVDLLLQAPVLRSVYIADGQMSLGWDPPAQGLTSSFDLTATPTLGAAASLVVTGSGYQGPAPAAFAAPGALTLAAVDAVGSGPAAQATLEAPCTITAAAYDGANLSVSTTLTGAAQDSYWFEVSVDGAILSRKIAVGSAAASVSLPLVLPKGASAGLRVIGVGPTSPSPASAPAAVASQSPTALAAEYDGANLHVSWTPVPGDGVGGYLVSVSNAGAQDLYVPGALTALAAVPVPNLTYPWGTNIKVTVRAVSSAPTDTGQPYVQGAPSLAIAPTLAGHAYSSGVGAAGEPPYLYRRGAYQSLADVTDKPIVLYLPKPFTGSDNPSIPESGATTFQLAPASGDPPLPYQLTLSADVWTSLGASAVRSDLRSTYVAFLSAVEDTGVYPWAIGLIRQIIAEAMPQTFEEVLYYRYGLWRSDSLRVVDLTPGARLQLSGALYQSIVGGSSPKNGFLATGAEGLDLFDVIPQGGAGALATGAGRSLSVDAFLSLIYPGGGGPANSRPVAAGPIDFFDDQNRQPYYRLFYPSQPSGSGSTGSTALEANITVIGAMSWKTLAAITDNYAQYGTFPTGVDYFATYFRGRSSLTPQIQVSVQGQPRWVTLGASVRQALSSQGLAPCFGGGGGGTLSMLR
ncbi:hypothetical protein, partial [Caulobacter sp.]|uniref:hypothetical protein n=1 Tax=Caulobacter sp. TaxID=78 RepID=UPI002B461F40